MKLTERIQHFESEHPGTPFFSLEFFPPRTDAGLENLYDRFDRMATLTPLWIDVTWGAGGSTAQKTLEICTNALKYHNLEPLMHLTCTNMEKEMLDNALEECRRQGIRNILALRGDPPKDQENWVAIEGGFEHACDLVRYIKKKYGDHFCVAVAAYPEGHLENPDKEDDLRRLKEKQDAGAEIAITQLFYDVTEYVEFIRRAEEIGITIPIIPGVMPIQSYQGFVKMVTFCKTNVPDWIMQKMEPIKDDDAAVKDFGVHLAVEMCSALIRAGAKGLHFYTLNLETSVMRIVDDLSLVNSYVANKALPWKRSRTSHREAEDVRPIFWANRPKSYVARTAAWDEFPNGRWTKPDSPAFSIAAHYMSLSGNPDERSVKRRLEMWGEELRGVSDIVRVFQAYLEQRPSTPRLPWCTDCVGDETLLIRKQLLQLVKNECLTINSQPRVNGALSTDPYFGWGPRGGFVYQKAYCEFFCSKDMLDAIMDDVLQDSWLSFSAVDAAGHVVTNVNNRNAANAVTWGVFREEEVKQPTVVNQDAFLAWKDEAFSLWSSEWAAIYPAGSSSRAILDKIANEWYLVNIVDNNYVAGDLFTSLASATTAAFKRLHGCSSDGTRSPVPQLSANTGAVDAKHAAARSTNGVDANGSLANGHRSNGTLSCEGAMPAHHPAPDGRNGSSANGESERCSKEATANGIGCH